MEGNQRRSINERARFFEISRGSVSEVAGVVDMAHLLGFIPDQDRLDVKLPPPKGGGFDLAGLEAGRTFYRVLTCLPH